MSDTTQDMNTAFEMALQLGQLQAGFLCQTAHELRSPMSHLMSLQQLILTDLCESPEEEREFIAQCYNASQRFMEMMDLVLDVSKLDYGTGKLKLESFDFVGLCGELRSLLTVKAKNHNLKLHLPTDIESEILIYGDRQRFRALFLGLLNTTVNQTETGDIHFEYGILDGDRLSFQVRSRHVENFGDYAEIKDLTLNKKPTLKEVKQKAQSLEFSPALQWQLCQKLTACMEGNIERQPFNDELVQVDGWLPLGTKK